MNRELLQRRRDRKVCADPDCFHCQALARELEQIKIAYQTLKAALELADQRMAPKPNPELRNRGHQ